MDEKSNGNFTAANYLSNEGTGRKIVRLKARQLFFAQGSAADSIYYLQAGRAKLTVVSKKGKEATITLLSAGDFMGEEALTSVSATR